MILYIRYPINSTRKILKLKKKFRKVVRYRIYFQKSIVFLFTNKKYVEKEIMGTFPFTMDSKSRISRNKPGQGSE